MRLLPFHIAAGVLALVFGYAALYAAKGGTLHRKSGMLFVYAMVTMSLTGAVMAALAGSQTNLVAGVLTFYFVTTALVTVRPRPQGTPWLDIAGVFVGLAASVLAFTAGADMLGRGRPEAAPMFIFGVTGLLASAGDVRMMRAGGLQGARRIARHLWRMCFAMWVAAASFFWGPPRRVPELIRIPPLMAIAVLLPIAAMAYWLWRLRVRNRVRGMQKVTTYELRNAHSS